MDAVKQLAIRGLNHLVHGESWAQERLRKHAGAHLLISAGLLTVRLGIDESGSFRLQGESAAENADVRLTLPADIVVRALIDRDNLFSSVKLEGSVDFAESLAFVFRNLKWDVEADLAGVIGDIAAHRLARIGRSLAGALHRGAGNALENVREYAVDESGLLPGSNEMSVFGNAVSSLRDDVARLEKRLSRL